jgi:hypothetical protein
MGRRICIARRPTLGRRCAMTHKGSQMGDPQGPKEAQELDF